MAATTVELETCLGKERRMSQNPLPQPRHPAPLRWYVAEIRTKINYNALVDSCGGRGLIDCPLTRPDRCVEPHIPLPYHIKPHHTIGNEMNNTVPWTTPQCYKPCSIVPSCFFSPFLGPLLGNPTLDRFSSLHYLFPLLSHVLFLCI